MFFRVLIFSIIFSFPRDSYIGSNTNNSELICCRGVQCAITAELCDEQTEESRNPYSLTSLRLENSVAINDCCSKQRQQQCYHDVSCEATFDTNEPSRTYSAVIVGMDQRSSCASSNL